MVKENRQNRGWQNRVGYSRLYSGEESGGFNPHPNIFQTRKNVIKINKNAFLMP